MTPTIRQRLADGNNPTAGSTELALRKYLPPKDGKTSTQRLHNITAAVYNNRTRTITPPLTTTEKEDLLAHMLEHAVRCIHKYNPQLDTHPTLPLETLFGRYTAKTVDQRATDWLRKHRNDPRPGRIQKTNVPLDQYLLGTSQNEGTSHQSEDAIQDAADRRNRMRYHNKATDPLVTPDHTDETLSNLRHDRWARAAQARGLTVQAYVELAADMLANQDLWAA